MYNLNIYQDLKKWENLLKNVLTHRPFKIWGSLSFHLNKIWKKIVLHLLTIFCSEWVPSEWEFKHHNNPQEIHTTPVHELISCEAKSYMFIRNKPSFSHFYFKPSLLQNSKNCFGLFLLVYGAWSVHISLLIQTRQLFHYRLLLVFHPEAMV